MVGVDLPADAVVDGSVAPLRWLHRIARPAVHAAVSRALAGVSTIRSLALSAG